MGEWWEKVLLHEPLSEPNIVLTQEGFISVIILWDNQSGPLSMFGCDQSAKLCKDIGKEVDSVFDPNTQRFGSSLEVGHMWKHFQTASAPPALSLGHSLRSVASLENMVRQGVAEKCRKTKSICTFQQFGNASEGR